MAEDPQQRILGQYDESVDLYEGLTSKVKGLVEEMLREEGIRVHSVTSRVKTRKSLHEKIARPDKNYFELSDVTDIAGVRVITYFDDDVDRVAKCLEREFIIDWENSIDRRAALDPDRFGYLSLHYVAELSSARARLLEYSRFSGLKAEVQTRSILQHAWAEMEHDLGYKTRSGVPEDTRRRFSALAGLLEIADREFSGIRDELAEYERVVPERIQQAPQSVDINKASLTAFYESSPLIDEIDQEIASLGSSLLRKEMNYLDQEWLIEAHAATLEFLNVRTIQDLETELRLKRQKIIAFVSEWFAEERRRGSPMAGFFTSGVSVLYLMRILAAKTQNVETIKEVELLIQPKQRASRKEERDIDERARHILETYKLISDDRS